MERQIIRYQGELWSEIPGHHGKYFASRNGQILSLAKSQSKPRVLRQIRDGEYLHVFLYDMPVGERSGTHKLTEAEVLEIRKARGTASLRELGAKYGVSHTAIRRAMLGIKWGYLEEGLR